MSQPSELTGGCACGAVRYKVTDEPLIVLVCHCTDCQTLSGSAFGLSMVLHKKDIVLSKGNTATNKFSTSHNRMHRHHCQQCGTALWFSSPEYADIVAVKPGSLDDTSGLRPVAHVWFRSAQPWLKIADGLPVYQQQPEFSELLALSADNFAK